MVSIGFRINGSDVSTDDFASSIEDALQVAILEAVTQSIQLRLRDIRCSEHQRAPEVFASGPSLDRLILTVRGCCSTLVDVAQAALNEDKPTTPEGNVRAPKVFLSHASEDKERFVLPFATKLRRHGIDAWLDRWEIFPGDSLVDKIFEEGLKDADAVIVVVSRNSADKPWVREELNAAFIKRVQGQTKLIPVIIDDCEVPEALQSTVWQKIPNLDSYDDELLRVVMAIFGASDRPALGTAPGYARTAIDTLPGLNSVDSLVMKAIGDESTESPYSCPHISDLLQRLAGTEVDAQAIADSLEVLENHHYIDGIHTAGGLAGIRPTHYGFDHYARTYLTDYAEVVQALSHALVNTDTRDFAALAGAVGKPQVVVEHILETMAQRKLVQTSKHMGGGWVMNVSPELRRSLQQQ